MTKDEIKKALEACADITPCENCLYNDVRNCSDTLKNDARELIIAQESEIERLRTTLGQCNAELNSALETLKSQCREMGELKAEVKQAQIDVLNKVMSYINDKVENEYGDMADSVEYLTINIDEFDDFIDELIKEVQK